MGKPQSVEGAEVQALLVVERLDTPQMAAQVMLHPLQEHLFSMQVAVAAQAKVLEL
jgi:hypothetical protein